MKRQPEGPEFYPDVIVLRHAGFRVERANPKGVRLNRRYMSNEELLQRAWVLLHPPVQLELFPD
jgi:hypothetical protein